MIGRQHNAVAVAANEDAAGRGVLSVLEPVVRVGPGENEDDAILDAARDLAPTGPSLYKAQVPLRGRGTP